MAFLMTDVAAGSDAAIKLQQNMGAAPLAQDVGRAQAEQVIANTEKTKLANLVADTGIKADAQVKSKLQSLLQDPAYLQSDPADQQRKLATIYGEAGKVDEMSKLLTASELTAGREVATKQKNLDYQAQQIGNLDAALSALPEDKVKGYVEALDQDKQKALFSMVPKEKWDQMTPAEQKAVTRNLMLNASKKLASQQRVLEQEKQDIIGKSKERVANISAQWHLQTRNQGTGDASKSELSALRAYTSSIKQEDGHYNRIENNLQKEIKELQVTQDFNRLQNKTDATLDKKIKEREQDLRDNEIKRIKSHISHARSLPEGKQKDRLLEELKLQASAAGIGSTDDKPKAPPAPSKGDTSNKTGVDTSNPLLK